MYKMITFVNDRMPKQYSFALNRLKSIKQYNLHRL